MNEFQREQVLEERAGERQRIQNARMLADLVRQQRGGSGDDNVSRAAKRAFAVSFLLMLCIISFYFDVMLIVRVAFRSTHFEGRDKGKVEQVG